MSLSLSQRALAFAEKQHVNQKRKNKNLDPYICHPIEVAQLCMDTGCADEHVISAAYLHDVVEDTGTSFQEIESKFGVKVCRLVRECTDDKKLDKVTRKKIQIEHAKEISDEAKLIKLADKYSNLKDLDTDPPQTWSKVQIEGYKYWSYAVIQNLKSINDHYLNELFAALWKKFGIPENLEQHVLDKKLQEYYEEIENQK